jgi:hypothetical protein
MGNGSLATDAVAANPQKPYCPIWAFEKNCLPGGRAGYTQKQRPVGREASFLKVLLRFVKKTPPPLTFYQGWGRKGDKSGGRLFLIFVK